MRRSLPVFVSLFVSSTALAALPADVEAAKTELIQRSLDNVDSWGDPAVLGAAQLASVLTKQNENSQSWWSSLGLHAVVAPRRLALDDELDDLRFRLTTEGGSEIVWGCAPSTQHPGELSVAKKIRRMADIHQRFKGLDTGPAPMRIDIGEWDHVRSEVIARETDTMRN